jgi:hypothetical protein
MLWRNILLGAISAALFAASLSLVRDFFFWRVQLVNQCVSPFELVSGRFDKEDIKQSFRAARIPRLCPLLYREFCQGAFLMYLEDYGEQNLQVTLFCAFVGASVVLFDAELRKKKQINNNRNTTAKHFQISND